MRHGLLINTTNHELTTVSDPPCSCALTSSAPAIRSPPKAPDPEPAKPALTLAPKAILTRPVFNPAAGGNPKISSIAQIGAAPFRTAARLEGSQVFAMSIREIMEIGLEIPEFDINLLPQEVQDLKDFFSKTAADRLPEHRKYDHKIQLNEGTSPDQIGTARLYRMSDKELKALKEYIDEHLKKDFIISSQAPFASPVLFVKKKNGDLRFCVDYRRLNAITKKDKYPLPLIDETLAQLTGAKFILKINVYHAFNWLCISEESEELTTFTTAFGTYKYKVMPFRLCNSPASFQHYINDVLWEGLNR